MFFDGGFGEERCGSRSGEACEQAVVRGPYGLACGGDVFGGGVNGEGERAGIVGDEAEFVVVGHDAGGSEEDAVAAEPAGFPEGERHGLVEEDELDGLVA